MAFKILLFFVVIGSEKYSVKILLMQHLVTLSWKESYPIYYNVMTVSSQRPEPIICLTESFHGYVTLQEEKKEIFRIYYISTGTFVTATYVDKCILKQYL